MKEKKITRGLILCIAAICLTYLALGIIYKPIVANDAVRGFLSLHNYLNGEGWNKLLLYNPVNRKITITELTWWSPGQYQLPYLLAKLVNCNIGLAISLLMFLSLAGGSYFYYKVFKLSGLGQNIILMALLVILLQRFINMLFIQYSSADLFVFFYVPFYLFIYLNVKKCKPGYFWLYLILLTAINVFGLFLKNSFLLFELAFNLFLYIDHITAFKSHRKSTGRFKNLLIICPFVLAFALNYWFFLRLGSNPSTSTGLALNFSTIVSGLFQSAMGIFFSSVSIASMFGNISRQLSFSNICLNVIMLAVLLIIAALLYRNRKNIKLALKNDIVFSIAAITGLMYILYWLAFAIKKSAVSNEDRLFIPAAYYYLISSVTP